MNDQTNSNEKEKESIQKELATLSYLYSNVDSFMENLTLFSDVIFDMYTLERRLKLESELAENYTRILLDIEMLKDSIRKQKSIYKIRLKTLEKQLK